ncbi:MAG: hypothetical protein HZA93_12655 [Verrucomicrobia bacterium]|nr:hypothetical protein [Verrucomicrobiota bacterium]
MILDEGAHRLRQVGDAALVEIGEDLAAVAGDEVGGDLRGARGAPAFVELAANDGEQRRLDVEFGQPLGGAAARAGDEFDDRAGDLVGHEAGAGFHDGFEGLDAVHAGEAHAVVHERGHDRLEALEVRQVVLAQRDDHAVVGGAEVERVQLRGRLLDAGDERFGRAVFDELGQLRHERDRALAGRLAVPLRP